MYCDKSFSESGNRSRHMKTHAGVTVQGRKEMGEDDEQIDAENVEIEDEGRTVDEEKDEDLWGNIPVGDTTNKENKKPENKVGSPEKHGGKGEPRYFTGIH